MKNRLMISFGFGVILMLFISFAVQARTPNPNVSHEYEPQFPPGEVYVQLNRRYAPSFFVGGGIPDLTTQSDTSMSVNIVLSGTILIMEYSPLGTMVLTTTQRLSGTFPQNPYFYPCTNASGLVFSSTGGTCSWNPNTELINCPTGITSFTFSYACNSVPTVSASNLSISLTSDWGGGGVIDRTWDFTYSPLIYQAASLPPDMDTGELLRWTQIDEANLTLDLFFTDSRVSLRFLPIVYK